MKVARSAGYALHVMTASGAVAGMLALQALIDNHVRAALIWLIVCQVLDGLDGPIARRIDVIIHANRVNGNILDLVVDYVTCVVVPVAFLVSLKLLPSSFETFLAAMIILFSALWFARNDLETQDHWFNGFPAVWNLVVPTFIIFDSSPKQVAWVSTLLCVSQLTALKFPHLVRVRAMRNITLPIAMIYLINLTILSMNYSDKNGPTSSALGRAILLAFPIYIGLLSFWRTFFPRFVFLGIRIADEEALNPPRRISRIRKKVTETQSSPSNSSQAKSSIGKSSQGKSSLGKKAVKKSVKKAAKK